MFVDQAKIYVKGGDGGNGMVAYRREKYVPLGGPSGGDGGRGGDVVFIVDGGLRTLMDFKYQKHFKATKGENGRNKNQHGRGASNLTIKVPPGTIVRDDDTNEVLGDLTEEGQTLTVARGGRGGRGNSRFATLVNKAPDMAEKGEPGEEKYLVLELRVLADVGLVGFPSVGKSTLLSVVSAATPKVADYPFTTLSPQLGVVDLGEGRSFVMADLPGLIEGAHEGLGLGHEFLRHVERTKVLVHVIDMAAVAERDPILDYETINQELFAYDEQLRFREQLVAANKMDLPGARENLEKFKERYPELSIHEISGVTRSGIKDLLESVYATLTRVESEIAQNEEAPVSMQGEASDDETIRTYRFEPNRDFKVHRDGSRFIVTSADLDKLVQMTNFGQFDAVKRFQHILKVRGVDRALRERGARAGDIIQIGDMEFDFVE